MSAVVAGGEGRALIIQNKGGGHGELGFHLAGILEKKGISVTLLHDGGPEPKSGKQPWDSYTQLEEKGVEIVWSDVAASGSASLKEGPAFEYVFDNWSKDPDSATGFVDLAKSWDVSNYVFVSSAGMYESSVPQPMVESADVKLSGQRKVEVLLAENGLPWTSFRPQYIYGPNTNKRDYLDWFFDRAVRGKPLPIPEDGSQGVSITNAQDVASLLASPLGNADAVGEVFNCGTDAVVTYEEVAQLVGKTVGKEVKVEYYDPAAFKLPKGAFPFRNTAFYVDVSKAKTVLGFAPSHALGDDMSWYYNDYVSLGNDKKDVDLSTDDMILS